MQNNNMYNIMNQMTQESKSLWRITNIYQKESESDELRAFWTMLAEQKEKTVADLKTLLQKEM